MRKLVVVHFFSFDPYNNKNPNKMIHNLLKFRNETYSAHISIQVMPEVKSMQRKTSAM